MPTPLEPGEPDPLEVVLQGWADGGEEPTFTRGPVVVPMYPGDVPRVKAAAARARERGAFVELRFRPSLYLLNLVVTYDLEFVGTREQLEDLLRTVVEVS